MTVALVRPAFLSSGLPIAGLVDVFAVDGRQWVDVTPGQLAAIVDRFELELVDQDGAPIERRRPPVDWRRRP